MKAIIYPSQSLNNLTRTLWAGVLLTLPVTSFRYFPVLGAKTFVRPLAFYPLVPLLLILFIQILRRKIPIPLQGSMIPMGVFLLFLMLATLFGALHAPLDLRGQTYWGRAIRAWLTVVIGLSFFIATIAMNRNEDDLKFTLRWMLAGFMLDILWSGVQALAFYTPILKKVTVTHWQLIFSMRELVKTNRISGLAYEPAWLAGQISTLYLPWLFAAVLTKTHLTRIRWLEALLLGLSGVLLLSTYSRGGLFTALGSVLFTFIFVGGKTIRNGWQWFVSGFDQGEPGWRSRLSFLGLRIGMVILILSVLAGAGFMLGQKNYFARLWNTQTEGLVDFIIENSAGARAAYSWGALGAYNEHPWFGVGLGASGFYIYNHLPDWALSTVPEIARQLDPSSRLYPNSKNMYVRILAESGLLGFSLYLAFLLSLLGDALTFLRRQGLLFLLGVAGLCSWSAIAFYNLTQDSFATPNIWVNLGILIGMANAFFQPGIALEERL